MYIPGGSSNWSLVESAAAVAALEVIGLALALVTGVAAPFAVTLPIADRVASFTSLNLSIN